MSGMGLSRRAYAALRGVSEAAVRKALATGRITAEPDGTIDPVRAKLMSDTAANSGKQRCVDAGMSDALGEVGRGERTQA
jgi:hypothetical protein